MKIEKHINSFLKSNSYLIYFNNLCVVVDPSMEKKFLELVLESDLVLKYIFLTHEHIDHITGIKELKQKYKYAKVVSSDFTANAIKNPKKNLSIFHGFEFIGENIDIRLINDTKITLSDSVKIKLKPCFGHSKGGVLIKINKHIFSGDEFIYGTKTITKLPGGNKNEVLNSYNYLKNSYEEDCLIHPGHGESFLLKNLELWS